MLVGFKDFIVLRAKKKILLNHPDWLSEGKMEEDTLDRIARENACIDYNMHHDSLMDEYITSNNLTNIKLALSSLVKLIEEPKIVVAKIVPITDIDKAVKSGRRTLLHIACEDGNFDEVVRLVEVCGASILVKDNNNWTPRDRASIGSKADEHLRIIKYLDEKTA